MKSRLLVLALLSASLIAGISPAAEIRGTVLKVQNGVATIQPGGDVLPNRGDKLQIVTEIPGVDDVAVVAETTVSAVEGGLVQARLGAAAKSVEPGQAVRITSVGRRAPADKTSDEPMPHLPDEPHSPNEPDPLQHPGGEILLSDSFNRDDAEADSLGQADHAHGGSLELSYLPIFPGSDGRKAAGARIVDGALENTGRDFAGVQLAAATGSRGYDLGQDLSMQVDLQVPTDDDGRVTQAGPYLRSRAAAAGDGVIGGRSAGYWVQLHGTGEVRIVRLNPFATIARSEKPDTFDSRRMHRLEVAAKGETLQVSLDGRLLTFEQDGELNTKVSIPSTWNERNMGSNDGTVGILFSAVDHRGEIGGQRADNFIVRQFRPLNKSYEKNGSRHSPREQ